MNDIYHSSNISVVVDNNILVDLYELNSIPLLFLIFDSVIIPKVIYEDETTSEIKEILKAYPFVLGSIDTEIGLNTYATLVTNDSFKRLSRYDRFAIAITKENHYYCNSNDKLVRKACEYLDVRYTGILGILGRAYKKDVLSTDLLKSYLDDLVSDKTSCYIDVRLIEQFKLEMDLSK
ncbi:hypothetical protein N7603_00685 [Acholeplasma vituli]|uniref:PIN domain-containing protein n=1 Tax=Paracholeplasma vituli TaxID=69473 RepID=A0ABT2PWQ4_9MOLU|nr:hypothetical protein [Paracholeplasma vituli]MCU0104177.1 hypothetical protein [Paracholeplasma vituli]